jgi:hypothetical protein
MDMVRIDVVERKWVGGQGELIIVYIYLVEKDELPPGPIKMTPRWNTLSSLLKKHVYDMWGEDISNHMCMCIEASHTGRNNYAEKVQLFKVHYWK